MVHKSFGDRSSISLLENLDADKVLLQFGKCGSYQLLIYIMSLICFYMFSYLTTIISLIGEIPADKCPPTPLNSSTTTNLLLADSTNNYYDKHISLADEFGINCENKYLLDHASGAFMFGRSLRTKDDFFVVIMAILIVGYVVTVESVATSFRSIQALINSLVWVLGIFVVGILYQFIFNWRYLYLCVVFPGLFTLSYYWAFPESLHWLITNKETEKVQKYLNLSQYVNRTKVNLEECQNDSNQTNKIRVKRNFLDLFKKPSFAFHLILNCYIFVVLNFVYWVLTLHSVDMHENRMVGFFLSAAVEIPAGIIAMLLLMIFGRRTVTFLTISGQTISLGLTIFTPRGTTPFLILSLIAKIMNTIAWASAPLLLSEMAPTTARNMSYGLISTAGEIGSSLSPYLNRIEDENMQKGIIALMSMMAPETFGKSLPQDLDDFDAGPFVAFLRKFSRFPKTQISSTEIQKSNCK
ncbi:unnamed protein product [Meloidogyne enterolobii]|uniref:Uncharacterized protein n=1 Tax=Meloidogyne enterolobii TaxID=390850 RepID=A0ACB0YD08_MELEN